MNNERNMQLIFACKDPSSKPVINYYNIQLTSRRLPLLSDFTLSLSSVSLKGT